MPESEVETVFQLGGQRPRLGRSFGQHHKVVRSRAAPARLVDGGLGCFGFEGVVVMVILWDLLGCII